MTLIAPGVYIEELPRAVHTIAAVETSIAAFVGRTRCGPVNEPTAIGSFADYERAFGGLWNLSPLGFAVRDFFANGGTRAVVVRLHHAASAAGQVQCTQLAVGGLNLEAANPGSWGNELRVRIDHDAEDGARSLFSLTVSDPLRGLTEVFREVSVASQHSRNVTGVLRAASQLIRSRGVLPRTRPAASPPHPEREESGASGLTKPASDGLDLTPTDYLNAPEAKTGIYALEKTDLFNLLCLPPPAFDRDISSEIWRDAARYCERRRAMLMVDPPLSWKSTADALGSSATGVAASGTKSANAAVYFPRLLQPNPLAGNRLEAFVPCGAVAGVVARTDTRRGIWKAPAGKEARLVDVVRPSLSLTDADNGDLNRNGINCLRAFPDVGPVVWGARTLQGADELASEWKYIPVRRMALFLEETLERGTRWVVFEPNDEPLWAKVRLSVANFMRRLFRDGAFAGATERDAFFVKCDRETTTQNDLQRGVVNIAVGFAPLKPAEFIIIKLQQPTAQNGGAP